MKKEVVTRDLPVDFLICDESAESSEHLHVIRPLTTFNFSKYGNQVLRIPNLLEVHRIFLEGGYDRIMCSTEFPMGLVSLFLKQAFNVETHFFMHTDWMEYLERTVGLEKRELDRVRRIIRMFYKQFDTVFALNTDHKKWLCGRDMGLKKSQVALTSHWADERFIPAKIAKRDVFKSANEDNFVLLYSGRISTEKGILDLPEIYNAIKLAHPHVKLVLAGSGTDEKILKEKLPDAEFLGWVDQADLPRIYAAADMLILPSSFDTFGCVILEAMQCACPVAAYKQKGPKDIIKHKENGLLGKDASALAWSITKYIANPARQAEMKKAALARSAAYSSVAITDQLLQNIGLPLNV